MGSWGAVPVQPRVLRGEGIPGDMGKGSASRSGGMLPLCPGQVRHIWSAVSGPERSGAPGTGPEQTTGGDLGCGALVKLRELGLVCPGRRLREDFINPHKEPKYPHKTLKRPPKYLKYTTNLSSERRSHTSIHTKTPSSPTNPSPRCQGGTQGTTRSFGHELNTNPSSARGRAAPHGGAKP